MKETDYMLDQEQQDLEDRLFDRAEELVREAVRESSLEAGDGR